MGEDNRTVYTARDTLLPSAVFRAVDNILQSKESNTREESVATPGTRDNEVVVADTGPATSTSTPLVTATLPGRAPAVLDPAEQVTLSSNAVSLLLSRVH